jgi:serine/threonine protein kinase
MSLAAGTRLGPYEIQSAIGAGGMAKVYKARNIRLGRTVATKVLPAQVSAAPERCARFEREARAISHLNDPHICTPFDVVDHDGSLFLVMEHVASERLAEHLWKGPLPFEQALTVATEIADALTTAHRQGVIHRDLKPGNVCRRWASVTPSGRPSTLTGPRRGGTSRGVLDAIVHCPPCRPE